MERRSRFGSFQVVSPEAASGGRSPILKQVLGLDATGGRHMGGWGAFEKRGFDKKNVTNREIERSSGVF
jgi:hypothetical protein